MCSSLRSYQGPILFLGVSSGGTRPTEELFHVEFVNLPTILLLSFLGYPWCVKLVL